MNTEQIVNDPQNLSEFIADIRSGKYADELPEIVDIELSRSDIEERGEPQTSDSDEQWYIVSGLCYWQSGLDS